MGVTSGTAHRQPQPDGRRGLEPVKRVFRLILIDDRAPLSCAHVCPDVTRGHLLFHRRLRHQITRQLVDRELVERHVPVIRLNHPVAPLPHAPLRVDVIPVRIRIPRRIHPVMRHVFAIRRRFQEPVHQSLVCLRPIVRQIRVHLLRSGRQPRQIQRRPPNQRRLVRLGRRLQPLLLQPRSHKCVDRVPRPLGILNLRKRRTLRRLIGPVLLPFRPRTDPLPNRLDLFRGQALARLGRRHEILRFRRNHPLIHQTLLRRTRLDRMLVIPVGLECIRLQIQTQSGFSLLLVRPMTGKTIVRENRQDIPAEANRCGVGSPGLRPSAADTPAQPEPGKN